MWQGRCARSVAQTMLISMQRTGRLPADPQGLIDAQYLPPECFFPRTHRTSSSLHSTSLTNGWLTAGEMHVDWSPAAWNWNTPVVALVCAYGPNDDFLLVVRSDASTDWVRPERVEAELSTWNADRAAHGLPPISAEVLPPAQ